MFDSLKIGIANIIMIVLCLGMLGSGMIKLVGLQEVVLRFEAWSYPDWFRIFVGIVEMAIGITLFIPDFRKYAVIALVVLMTGAVGTHIYHQEYGDLIGPIMVMMGGLLMVFFFESAKEK